MENFKTFRLKAGLQQKELAKKVGSEIEEEANFLFWKRLKIIWPVKILINCSTRSNFEFNKADSQGYGVAFQIAPLQLVASGIKIFT